MVMTEAVVGWLWDEGRQGVVGGSRHAQLSSDCGQGPTKTPGLLKPPWMSPRGQRSGRNAGLGLEVQGYVLLLMSSPHWASLAPSPPNPLSSHTSAATTSHRDPDLEPSEHAKLLVH